MKKLFFFFLIINLISNQSYADDIKDFQIEGMSIGDSLLKYASKNEIEKYKKFYPGSKKWSRYSDRNENFKTYEGFQVHFKNNDSKYTILALQGMKLFENNIKDCYVLKDEIVNELSNSFPKLKKESWKKKHVGDKTGKSTTDNTAFKHKDGWELVVTCSDWSPDTEFTDKISVSIVTKEFLDWIEDEAY
tara:strand:- start:822 stop:1391 length:570 start_codon:yes stop_codon:yes gene_type:complete